MPNKEVTVNLDALPRPLAQAVRYLAEQSWQTQSDKVYIPTSDAAKMLGIPRSTLNYWCRQGRVKAWHDGPRRGWRVDVDDVREYLISLESNHAIPQPPIIYHEYSPSTETR